MQFPLYLAKRIIGSAHHTFSGFIIKMAIAGTAISVATMVVALCMINGFQSEVAQKVYSFWGEVRVQSLQNEMGQVAEETPLLLDSNLVRYWEQSREVGHVQAFANKSVVLRSNSQFEGVLLKGIDSNLLHSNFSQFMMAGKMPSYPEQGYGSSILLSQITANRLQVQLGDTLHVFFIRQGEEIRTRSLFVSGIFKTGIEDYDAGFAIVDIRFLQRLNLWTSNQVAGLEFWLKPSTDPVSFAKKLDKAVPQGFAAGPVAYFYPNIFDWLAIQNQTKRVVIGIMLVVAIINLSTCLFILFLERVKMVAVLEALGMLHSQVMQVFWYYALWIALVGIGLGMAVSLSLLALQKYTGFIKMKEATYYVDRVPVHFVWWQIMLIAIGTFLTCFITLWIPLRFVQRISITKVLQFK